MLEFALIYFLSGSNVLFAPLPFVLALSQVVTNGGLVKGHQLEAPP